ncbi:MAG: 2-amino-4-hydroxy-6-hydroxymethyldihydropteridine diphosphokinase [Verrucomicrobia bacterium]|nr:2-amino-4-hydroxy-6-hydroxymethyldihydropteridine diphosphokinase [Verrucomicrobiota bacterium]NBU07501.1 2-amino-4-hydroxy-6-hydroxymethyldihydropteridine diphosphokinase [Pseudomonadota bacterium]NDA68090.1 2-amino-4-hydroxy-6-hydroxymethyldihydropteridine diphosphokinase [Verrucomicrobiota bacterium]NDD37710.1 2-amino-4-hydroxy-6-hydroxymethyldihydropteridine diphosphokinase [Verrucomicrobiota bacterium]NDE97854.1 2-amino-4-hydroxy-6-hydroxymethyldihydropteridine diphosphokinase [Verrucom
MNSEFRIQNSESQTLAFVALGGNLGDAQATVRDAIERLATLACSPVRSSSLWRSTPVDCPAGSPDFINAVVAFAPLPRFTPETLLVELQTFEREFGRVPKKVINEARPLDLDLLTWGGEVRNTPTLTLPHPRAHLRRFVLQPLSELAPDLVLPRQTRTVTELLTDLPLGEVLERVR